MRMHPVPLAIICLLAGGAGGWLLHGNHGPAKSGSAAQQAKNGPATSGGTSDGGGNSRDDQEFAAPPRLRPTDPSADDDSHPDDDSAQYAATMQADLEWRLNSWKASLGLKPDQVAKLEQQIKKSIADFKANPDGDDAGPSNEPEESLNAALSTILDADQNAKYDAWSKRKQEVQREAQAAQQMAELEDNLLLEGPQREAVRKALLEQAAQAPEQQDTRPPAPMIDSQMLSDLTEKLGDKMDDPQEFQKASKEWIDKRINNDVEHMKSVLKPDQLDSYRHLLERKYSGWMDPTQ